MNDNKISTVAGYWKDTAEALQQIQDVGILVTLTGSTLAEQLTNADAIENILTFSENITNIEIYHTEATWQEFEVNGITLTIPPGVYRTPVGGIPGVTVTIPASVSCIVSRLV